MDSSEVAVWLAAAVAVATLLGILYKLITRDLGRDVAETRKEMARDKEDLAKAIGAVDHKVNNERGRINALENLRTSDIERVVRVETSIASVEKMLGRIDVNMNDRFDQVAQSIREIRHVEARRG